MSRKARMPSVALLAFLYSNTLLGITLQEFHRQINNALL